MTSERIVRIIRVVVVPIVHGINDDFYRIIFPELGVFIIGIKNIVIDIHSNIKIGLIVSQPVCKAGIGGIVPGSICWKIKDPCIVAGSNVDP